MNPVWFEAIVNHLSEGVVVMDADRIIHYLNPLAANMTGWVVGARVPYCSYCQMRYVEHGEERCILAREDRIPVFQESCD
ncbi:PAS domain-containing protein [Ammoniphilus sp. CFH 90114]|uniref:PAS domain-containing protein n=1 Tax=Ammoniphilus sp. CFH 90114 TaxID=2493665 RepID=UPI00100ED59E|nr:PAS domain-containing protein [Ammoniphilus sp. CFH 90114]RXT06523.1 PAS domain-containing protein [Ammoniphilus sp. CFH 90114]